jgi:hypothetical protein
MKVVKSRKEMATFGVTGCGGFQCEKPLAHWNMANRGCLHGWLSEPFIGTVRRKKNATQTYCEHLDGLNVAWIWPLVTFFLYVYYI